MHDSTVRVRQDLGGVRHMDDEPPLRLLLVDDSRFDVELLEARLRSDGVRYTLRQADTEAAFRAALEQPCDLVISEVDVGQFGARAALGLIERLGLDIPLIILTADAEEAGLTALIRTGAIDYVFKTRLGRLTLALRLAVERARLVQRLSAKREDMARLSLDLINAQEDERKALARELHDELGQRLTALNLLLHRAQPFFRDADAQALWCQSERELASLVGLVRDMSVSLRPPGLDYFGLETTLHQLLQRRFEGGPTWVFEYAGLPRRLASSIEISVFRLVQESVTNIVRHARAHHVVVEINGGATGAELELIVRDDGVGFDASCWREQGAHRQRAGLVGMAERVQLIGGQFRIDSLPGHGTRIIATLPLHPMEES
jgi:signal transduction histidine kinase